MGTPLRRRDQDQEKGNRKQHPLRLSYGLREGRLQHVSEVQRGLACGCTCPACGDHLIARKGPIREHHFAHAAGHDCRTAVETTLHMAAKEILASRREIVLPNVKIQFPSGTRTVAEEKRFQLTSVALERRLTDIVPDVIARVRDRPLLIEVRVTHGIEPQKLARIRSIDLSTVEIDLSAAPRDLPRKNLEELVVGPGAHKRWIHNAFAERRLRRMLASATVRETTYRGFALHADGCPLPARVWRGKPYANVMEDCAGCEHAVKIEEVRVFCGA